MANKIMIPLFGISCFCAFTGMMRAYAEADITEVLYAFSAVAMFLAEIVRRITEELRDEG